jgi:hypothetical protein
MPFAREGPEHIGHDTSAATNHPARNQLDAPHHLSGRPAREGRQQDFAGIGTIDD